MRELTIGVDLGTTNSVVASTDRGGEPRVLPDEHDEKIHPSVVSFHPNGTVIVGAVAKQRRVIDPANTVYSVKRLIGRPFDSPEVQAARTRMPFHISEGSNEQPVIHTRGGQFAIPEISAIVLDHMRAIAKRAQRSVVSKAVITVPANFSEGQRGATATAGAIAGLEVIQILNEPTAAALAYGHRKNLDRLIAVYDFGGGTFDVTILQVKDHLYEVLATAGNSFLGGDDIDETLVEHMVEIFLREQNVDLRADDLAMQRLRSVAEQIKIQLSRRNRAIIKIDEIAYGPGGRGLDLNLQINRDELIARCAHVVDRTFPVCDDALKLAGIGRDSITDIVLVGGTTKMPYVRQRATQYFGNQPRVDVNPDEAVALGAALQADIIARELAGEPIRRRTGSIDTKSEVTRVDEQVGRRVADMIRATEARRASAPSSSVIIGDEEMSFADDYTDGSGIFITVDTDADLSQSGTETMPTAVAPPSSSSGITHPLIEPDSVTSAEDWATDSGFTDEGWDAPAGWSAEPLAGPTRAPSEMTAKAGPETLRQFGSSSGRTTERGMPRPPPMPAPLPGPDADSADDLPTLSREPQEALRPLAPEQSVALHPDQPDPLKPHTRTSPPSPHQPFRETDVSDKASRPVMSPPPMAPPKPPRRPPPPSRPPPPPPVPAASPLARTLFEPQANPPLQETPSALGPQLYDPNDIQRRGNPLPPAQLEPAIPALYDPKGLQNQPPAPAAPPMPFGSDPGPGDGASGPPAPADSMAMTAPALARPKRDSVSQYGVPELGSTPFQPPMIKDVTSYALGIGTVGGFCESLVARNTQVPHETKRRFSTSKSMQTTVRIKVFQGESRRLDQNRRLGDLVLEGLPPRPRGETTIDVSFVLNASGMLEVHAVDVATGYQQSASIEIRGAQSADEVAASQDRMRKMFQ